MRSFPTVKISVIYRSVRRRRLRCRRRRRLAATIHNAVKTPRPAPACNCHPQPPFAHNSPKCPSPSFSPSAPSLISRQQFLLMQAPPALLALLIPPSPAACCRNTSSSERISRHQTTLLPACLIPRLQLLRLPQSAAVLAQSIAHEGTLVTYSVGHSRRAASPTRRPSNICQGLVALLPRPSRSAWHRASSASATR